MNKTILKKYAKLITNVGVNIKKGQKVIVYASVEVHEFVKLVVAQAYKCGASKVSVEWSYQDVTKLNYKNQSLKTLSKVEDWREEKFKEAARELPCKIHIISDDPDGLFGVDKDKMQKASIANYKVLKKYIDEMDNKYQWTIAAVPSAGWAKKVFPDETKINAVKKLWDAILSSVHITKDNEPVTHWNMINNSFKEKCDKLNEYNFDYLEYKSSNKTDFKVWLIEGAKWMGGGETTISGNFFNPNLPTEEVFITPMKGRAEGRVVSTKPLSFHGQLIDNFEISFKDGKVFDLKAEKGEEILSKMITMDDGACMLGEVALVPKDSPINKSNILFYNTLFDENASCHLALGMGFANCIDGFENMSKEQLNEIGVNDSIIHADFMIGCDDLNINGYTRDGKCIKIFENGNWAL